MKIRITNGEVDTYSAFIDEARDHLDTMEVKILGLAEACDDEQINLIFRGLHSIKGVASFLGLGDIQKLSHQLESVFDWLRQGKAGIEEKAIQTCLAGLDHLVQMVKFLEKALSHRTSTGNQEVELDIEDVDFSLAYAQMQAILDGVSPTLKSDPSANNADAKGMTEAEMNAQFDDELITQEMRIVFKRESDDLLESTEQMLMDLEQQPENAELLHKAFRNIHSYKGNCGFFGLADNEKLAHSLETLMECLRSGEHAEAFVPTVLFGLRCIDAFRHVHHNMEVGGSRNLDGLEERLKEAEQLLTLMEGNGDIPAGPALSAELSENSVSEAVTHPTTPSNPTNSPQFTEPDSIASSLQIPTKSNANANQNQATSTTSHEAKRDLRVDLSKLDLLLDMVGELVIASGMVINHPKLRQMDIPELDKVFHQLQGVVADLQQIALGVRMVPVEGVFKKMGRLVHDLSAKFGKQVRLDLVGEKTEIDKNLGDLLADPLVHMIRNSIDHGLETPQQRREAGKPPHGTITLAAEQEGGDIIVTIRDDGKGMNRNRILEKAVEKGLVDASAAELPDEDIFKFIFLPGFSTADAVTSTSGRGVGMDVVKSNVDRMNGRIQIKSTMGLGTTIYLRIPLTLSIIEGMQVRVGRSLFILPMLAVQESVAPHSGQITHLMGEDEVLLLRGNTYPIVRLHQLHHLKNGVARIEDGILLRIESQGAVYCLLVDEIVGQRQTVVKALPNFFGRVPGVTACSILDDGAISLILDPPGIWSLHCESHHSSYEEPTPNG